MELSDRVSKRMSRSAARGAGPRAAVLKKLLEPAIENPGVGLMFVAHRGYRHLVDQVPPQDGYLFLKDATLALVAYESSPL